MIKKELDYHYIEGSYGGNQEWFAGPMMKLGGYGAETACESAIYFTIHKGLDLYPFDINHLTVEDYKKYKDYDWHWFIINGYKYDSKSFYIKAVTYSEYEWIDLAEFWDTGYERKGGLVLFDARL